MRTVASLSAVWLLVFLAMPLGAQVTLRTEFQDTQPKFIKGSEGKFSGLCVEMLGLIEKHSEFRFTYPGEFIPIGRIGEDLKAGRIDVYAGLVKTPQREGQIVFLAELFTTRYQILARKGDPALKFTTVAQLQQAKIPLLVIPGAGPAVYYQSIPGLLFEDAPASVETTLKRLAAGQGRLFAYYDLANDWFLDTLGYRSTLAAVPLRLDTDVQYLCVSNALDPAVTARLGQVVEGVKKTPAWAALMKKYFP